MVYGYSKRLMRSAFPRSSAVKPDVEKGLYFRKAVNERDYFVIGTGQST